MSWNGEVRKEDRHNAVRAQVNDVDAIKLDSFSTTKEPIGEEGTFSYISVFLLKTNP